MGLSIHYNGSFNPAASLAEMIAEIKDIAETFKWPCNVFETAFPQTPFPTDYDDSMYGISFTPPGCETVSICFLSNGRMSCPILLKLWGKNAESPNEAYLYMLSVKTQFAGMQTHMLLIRLLRRISNNYLMNFQLSDEGQYWETENETLLKEKFNLYDRILDTVSNALENIPRHKGESWEDYFSRILKDKRMDE